MSTQQHNDVHLQVAQNLNKSVLAVLGSDKLILFEKTFLIAQAAQELKAALTPEYMKPIMSLQGNKLGFKTDKDNQGGYDIGTVKNCLIEAVLTGVQPFGNQFNIIAGNCYITKEGFGYLLNNTKGLTWEVIAELPRINNEQTSGAVVMNITWSINNGETLTRKMDMPVKVNKGMGADGVVGKATRKARAWLFNRINGTEISDGDVQDVQATVVSSKINVDKEYERIVTMIDKEITLEGLMALRKKVDEEKFLELIIKIDDKMAPLIEKS
jgi:hypothetical protein